MLKYLFLEDFIENTVKIISLSLLLNGTIALAATESSRQQIVSAVKNNPTAVLGMIQDSRDPWAWTTAIEEAIEVNNAALVHELFVHPDVGAESIRNAVVHAVLCGKNVDLFEFIFSKVKDIDKDMEECLDHALNIYGTCFNQEEFEKPYFSNIMIKYILNRTGVRPSHACILSCYEAFKKYPKDHLIEEEKTKLEELLEILRVAAFPNPS